jgi:hypothetical protein
VLQNINDVTKLAIFADSIMIRKKEISINSYRYHLPDEAIANIHYPTGRIRACLSIVTGR